VDPHLPREGIWAHIQDNEVLDQCVGVSVEWQALICRETVVGVAMTGRLPLGVGGPPAGGAPLTDKGPRGGDLGAL